MNPYFQKLRESTLWKKISYADFYQKIRFPERYKKEAKEYIFYLNLLGNKNHLIFDIGANTGEKAAILKKLSKKLICFEPSPNSIKTLQKRFAYCNVSIQPLAISNKKTTSKLYLVEGRETLNSINEKQLDTVIKSVSNERKISSIYVATDTLDNVIEKFGVPDYIKIDVEGNEREVISGLSNPTRYLSFENCTTLFLKEGIESINHLLAISNGKALFNVYVDDSFIFSEFSDAELIKEHISNNKYGAAEIFCKSF